MIDLILFIALFTPIVWLVFGTQREARGIRAGKPVRRRFFDVPMESNDLNTPEGLAPNDALQCSLYEVRLTQQKMVDAGIIEQWELSTCNNPDCNNCYVTDPAFRHSIKRVPRYRPKRELLSDNGKSERTTTVRGELVSIPFGVPDNAHAAIEPDEYAGNYEGSTFKVLWTWTDTETGRPMGMKSVHMKRDTLVARRANIRKAIKKPQETCSCNCEDIEIRSGDGSIVRLSSYVCDNHKPRAPRLGTEKSYK